MSAIKRGDRVKISHAHCLDHMLGTQFTVAGTGKGWARCLACGASLGETAYAVSAGGMAAPLSWINKIDPQNSSEALDADAALELECRALLKPAGPERGHARNHRVVATAAA